MAPKRQVMLLGSGVFVVLVGVVGWLASRGLESSSTQRTSVTQAPGTTENRAMVGGEIEPAATEVSGTEPQAAPANTAGSTSDTQPGLSKPDAIESGADRASAADPDSQSPRPQSGTVYAVHVSSYRTSSGAASEVATLEARGYAARSVRTDLGSKGIWYRIYVGQYATAAEAKRARDEIIGRKDTDVAYVRPLVQR